MTFLSIVRSSHFHLVYLIKAKEKPSERDAWWYIQVKSKIHVPVFLRKVKTVGVDIPEHGTLLYSGWGKEPPQYVKRLIKKKFS